MQAYIHRLPGALTGVADELDRRLRQIRKRHEKRAPDRRRAERRRLNKPLKGRDDIVIHVADGRDAGTPP